MTLEEFIASAPAELRAELADIFWIAGRDEEDSSSTADVVARGKRWLAIAKRLRDA